MSAARLTQQDSSTAQINLEPPSESPHGVYKHRPRFATLQPGVHTAQDDFDDVHFAWHVFFFAADESTHLRHMVSLNLKCAF